MDGGTESKVMSRNGAATSYGRRDLDGVSEDPTTAIAMMRSRLRHVTPAPSQPPPSSKPRRSQADTIDELNTLLDDAIERNSPKPEVSLDDQLPNLMPKPGFVLRRASRQDREHQQRSTSRGRPFREVNESVEPRSSEDSTRAQYGNEGPAQEPNNKGTVHVPPPVAEPTKTSKAPAKELSPVKQRAALFENLSKPTIHDPFCQCVGHEHDYIHDREHRAHPEQKNVHRIKFRDRIDERPATPLIPLTLPTIVTKEKSSRPSSAASRSPSPPRHEQAQPSIAEIVAESDQDQADEKIPEHKTSSNWPFRWGLLSKGSSVRPEETIPMPVEALKDDHYLITRPSLVRSKVQQILQAANQKDDAERERREAEQNRLNRNPSRARGPPRRAPSGTRYASKKASSATASLQETPAQDLPEAIRIVREDVDAKTPLQHAMTEKQVLVPPSQSEKSTEMEENAQKSQAQTPIRGRPSQSHFIHQRFDLSPSRSASRGRQAVKVEVEIRDSPDKKARERGDKIVVIKADVSEADE
jgi:hypothetical protein